MKKHWLTFISVVCALAWSAPITAERQREHDRGHGKKAEKAEKAETREERVKHEERETHEDKRPPIAERAVVIDRDGHRRVVTEFFSRESLPPGLAKRQSLPPGLQRQLRERGHLPPGLQKRLVPVPPALTARLQPLPPHFSQFFAGRDLIVVDTRTNAIVAVIPHAY